MPRPRVIGRRWTVKDLLTYNFANLPPVLDGIEIDDHWFAFRSNLPTLSKWRESHPSLHLQVRPVVSYPPEPYDFEGIVPEVEQYLRPEAIVVAQGAKGEMWDLGSTSLSWLAAQLGSCLSRYLSERTFGTLVQCVGVPRYVEGSSQSQVIRLAWHYCQMAAAAGVTLQANCWGNNEKWTAWQGYGPGLPTSTKAFEFANLWSVPPAQRSLEPGHALWQEDEAKFRRMLEQAREIQAAQIVLYHYGTKLQHAEKLLAEVWPEAALYKVDEGREYRQEEAD